MRVISINIGFILLLLKCVRAFVPSRSTFVASSWNDAHGDSSSPRRTSPLKANDDNSDHPYLDRFDGTIEYERVPWQVLNFWLSELNCNAHVNGTLCNGVNREKIVEELVSRMEHEDRGATACDFGYGFDWREYENQQGYTHLEELLIYQPKGWKEQAREYLYRFDWDLERASPARNGLRFIEKCYSADDGTKETVSFSMSTPTLVVLFHPEMSRTSRYDALNFLLAYGVKKTLISIFQNVDSQSYKRIKELLLGELSPLQYFIEFQMRVQSYSFDILRKVAKQSAFPRLPLIKELDFSKNVVGQRLAKHVVRQQVVKYILKRKVDAENGRNSQPLSLIFSGPSGNGKTELAMQLAELMNKPGDDAFLKIDCGKLTTAHEVFGMSGAYYGSKEGSALNNFVLRMSKRPESIGIVLLDEIEKAGEDVIHGLYQVIDKAEWTNKKMAMGKDGHTETLSCFNIIFIMTTNAADKEILDYAKSNDVYTANEMDLEEIRCDLERKVRSTLQTTSPFNGAFIARVGGVVPFLPMSNKVDYEDPLLGEMMTVAKMFIEREQENPSAVGELAEVEQQITTETKHRMAELIVSEAIPEAGVRAIRKDVEEKMGDRILHSLLLERGGIGGGSCVSYAALEDGRVQFRVLDSGDKSAIGIKGENGMYSYGLEEDASLAASREDILVAALRDILEASLDENAMGDDDTEE